MGVEPELVGLDQHFGADGGVGLRGAEADEYVAHEAFHEGEGDPRRAFIDVHEGLLFDGRVVEVGRTGQAGAGGG